MDIESGTLFGETSISAPADDQNIMVDCNPRFFPKARLQVEFAGPVIHVERQDKAPIQIKRVLPNNPLAPGVLGLRHAVEQMELAYSTNWRMWLPADMGNVSDERAVNKFANLIHVYGARQLLENSEIF